MISAGTAFLIVLFYLICLIAARVTGRPRYKRMWSVATFVLGAAIVMTAGTYIIEVGMILLAL